MLIAQRCVLLLVLVPAFAGCAVSGSAFALDDEPAFQSSISVRRSPNPGRRPYGWRAGVDRFHLAERADAWAASGDLYVPFLSPGFIVAGLGGGPGEIRWTATAGLGTELDMRGRNQYWGVLAEGGVQLVGFVDEGSFTEWILFARLGLYACFRPLPCSAM